VSALLERSTSYGTWETLDAIVACGVESEALLSRHQGGEVARTEVVAKLLDALEFLTPLYPQWQRISALQGPLWCEDLIERLVEEWDWTTLSANPSLPWSRKLLHRFEERWNWHQLSQMNFLPWNAELIAEFASSWNWTCLSSHTGLTWSIDLLERFAGQWDWSALSANPALPWTPAMIAQFADAWDWWELSGNSSIHWTLEDLHTYPEHWSHFILRPQIWGLLPALDTAEIEEVMARIVNKKTLSIQQATPTPRLRLGPRA
jgi:hypothetical protein